MWGKLKIQILSLSMNIFVSGSSCSKFGWQAGYYLFSKVCIAQAGLQLPQFSAGM